MKQENHIFDNSKSKISYAKVGSEKYEIVDKQGREQISINTNNIDDLYDIVAGGVHYRGKTTSNIFDGANVNPIIINGETYTAQAGDLIIKDVEGGESLEFVFDGAVWSELGSTGVLGTLAYKDNASTQYKPKGSVTTTLSQTNTQATLTKGDYTPVGTNAASSVTLSGGATSKLVITTIKGVAGTTTLHDTPTLNTTNVGSASNWNAGSLPSLGNPTTGSFGTSLTAGTEVSVDTDGVKCSVPTSGDDVETLVFSSASKTTLHDTPTLNKANALTAQGTFSKGTLPSLTITNTAVGNELVAGTATVVATASANATTVATGAVANTGTGATVATALHTGGTAAAQTFTGTKAENILVTDVKYDKTTSASSTFNGIQETITVS